MQNLNLNPDQNFNQNIPLNEGHFSSDFEQKTPKKSPLINHASNVSHPKNNEQNQMVSKRLNFIKIFSDLRDVAGGLLPKERVSTCGQIALGGFVKMVQTNQNYRFTNVETCGSVWSCPVCAAKVTEGRREELLATANRHVKTGGKVAMVTLTLPHYQFQRCRELKTALTTAWRKVKAGKAWQGKRDKINWVGDVKALEVTHGGNGWHPHLHILVFFTNKALDIELERFSDWLFKRWKCAIFNMGMGDCSDLAYSFKMVDEAEIAAEYIGKWGIISEITRGTKKLAKGKSRTPWQILSDYKEFGREEDKKLFVEYAKAFKCSRQLTYSQAFKRIDGTREPSLKERYGIKELSDERLAKRQEEEGKPELAGLLRKELYRTLARDKRIVELYETLDIGGVEALPAFFDSLKIPIKISSFTTREGLTVPVFIKRKE